MSELRTTEQSSDSQLDRKLLSAALDGKPGATRRLLEELASAPLSGPRPSNLESIAVLLGLPRSRGARLERLVDWILELRRLRPELATIVEQEIADGICFTKLDLLRRGIAFDAPSGAVVSIFEEFRATPNAELAAAMEVLRGKRDRRGGGRARTSSLSLRTSPARGSIRGPSAESAGRAIAFSPGLGGGAHQYPECRLLGGDALVARAFSCWCSIPSATSVHGRRSCGTSRSPDSSKRAAARN